MRSKDYNQYSSALRQSKNRSLQGKDFSLLLIKENLNMDFQETLLETLYKCETCNGYQNNNCYC